jgi:hypothetical protein
MNSREKKVLLLASGFALLAFGHRLANKELGELGVPHLLGAAMLAAATSV